MKNQMKIFFIDAYELDKFKAATLFERNNKATDLKNPRNCLNYIDSFNVLP